MKIKKSLFILTSLIALPFVAGCGPQTTNIEIPDIPVTPSREVIGDLNTSINPYKIVVPVNASSCIMNAAEQISNYFKQVSDKQMEIITDEGLSLTASSRYISLWKTTIFTAAELIHGEVDLTKDSLNNDGYYMFTYGENLFINSYIERGTLYGAYQFIEDSFNVKFLTQDFTYVPKINGKINLYKYDEAFIPEFEQRCYLNSAVWDCDNDYVSHLRFNTDFAQIGDKYGGYTHWCDYGGGASGTTHSLQLILPATNDEFCEPNLMDTKFPNCKRIKQEYHEVWSHSEGAPTTNDRVDAEGNCDLCFTNGIEYNYNQSTGEPNANSAVKLVFESLKNFIINYSDCDNFMLGQADTPSGCPCSHCVRATNKYNNKRSALTIIFANKLSTMVEDWIDKENIKGPDGERRRVNFSIFAYTYNEEPPLNNKGELVDPACKPLKNVFVKYAPIWSTYYFGLDDIRNTSNTYGVCEKWATVADTMLSWTYHSYFSDYFWYLDTTHGLKGTLQTLKNCGVIYAMGQGTYTEKVPYQQFLEAYVYGKLCWDLNKDVNDLVDEFLYYYFGPDAFTFVRRFHSELTLKYEEIALSGPSLLRAIDDLSMFLNWPLNVVNNFVSYFDMAYQATINNESLTDSMKNSYCYNIKRGSLMPLYMRLKNAQQYASLSSGDVTELALEFVSIANYYGVVRMGEGADLTLANLKKQFGI